MTASPDVGWCKYHLQVSLRLSTPPPLRSAPRLCDATAGPKGGQEVGRRRHRLWLPLLGQRGRRGLTEERKSRAMAAATTYLA